MSIEIPKGIELRRPQPGAALTPLDKRAIVTAWTPAAALALIPLPTLATAVRFASSQPVFIAPALLSCIVLALLPRVVRSCSKLAAHRIIRADLIAAAGIAPYDSYCQWVASLPEPGPVWRALGAPTPHQRLRILREFRALT